MQAKQHKPIKHTFNKKASRVKPRDAFFYDVRYWKLEVGDWRLDVGMNVEF